LLFGIWNVGNQHFFAIGEGETASMMDKILYGLGIVLPIVVVSYGVGLGVEFIFCIIKGHSIQEGFLVSGLLIPLVMPPDVPLWMVAIGTIFAVVIGKEVFGGTGMNIVNVALTARAFLFFAYPTFLSGEVWISGLPEKAQMVDGFTGATNLGHLASLVQFPEMKEAVMAKVATPYQSFMGFEAGSIGETSALAILIGAGILIYTGIGSWRIMLSMFAGGFAMQAIFNAAAVNPYMEVEPIHQLMMGGFMFAMVFMATDPVTAAQTTTGKYIYGFLAGVFTILIRVLNPAYPEGAMMAILLMNITAPLIDHYVIQANVKRRLKRAKLKTA
jgi:Na+-transporting NADH:ubiquinone oxidoreductase subunit B